MKKEKFKKGKEAIRKVGRGTIKVTSKIVKIEKKVKEKIVNVPNAITLLRVIGTPLLVYILLSDYSSWFKASAFLVFALSDMLDGYIARNFNQTTKFGAKFDMLADRLFFSAAIITILIKLFIEDFYLFSPYLMLLLLSREIIALPIAAYMFFTKTPFVKAKFTGKLTTFLQGAAITAFLAEFDFSIYLIIATGISGIYAGITYWKDSFSVIKNKKSKLGI